MSDGRHPNGLIDILLFYVRFRYLSATECLVYLFLHDVANGADCGYANYEALSTVFGRSTSRCRSYLKRLKRVGLIEEANPDGHGGVYFTVAIPESDSDSGTS